MNRNLPFSTVACNIINWINRSIWIVRARCVNTYCIWIHFPFHVWNVHFKIFIKFDSPWFNLEIVACFKGCSMSWCTNQEVWIFYALYVISILSIGKNRHNNWFCSSRKSTSNSFSIFRLKLQKFRTHLNHLNLHLFYLRVEIIV